MNNLKIYDEAEPYPNMPTEEKQKLLEIFETVITPKFKAEFSKQITIYGTVGELSTTQNLKDLFYNVRP